MIITAEVVAHEGHNVATFYTPGEYLHTKTDKGIIMLMERSISEFMVKVTPKIYLKYVIIVSKGKLILYLKMQKDGYNLIWSALIFYIK